MFSAIRIDTPLKCRVPHLMPALSRRGMWFACALLGAAALPKATAQDDMQPLLKSSQAWRQRVPIVTYFEGEDKAQLETIRMRWDLQAETSTLGDDVVAFKYIYDKDKKPYSLGLLQSQFWISALASAMAWQEPWRAARWTISDVPEIDGPGVGASLAIGMMATASGTPYPKDTVVIGSLNPDGSLGAVAGITKRLEAAGQAGKKRVILPTVQRVQRDANGTPVPVETIANKYGMKAVFASDLFAATEAVLGKSLPPPAMVQDNPSYQGELFNYLNNQAQIEQRPLLGSAGTWPRDDAQLNQLQPTERQLWNGLFTAYDAGLDAYAAGLLYVAWIEFEKANAYLAAIKAWRSAPPKGTDFKPLMAKANELRNQMIASMNKPAIDKNELQSALVLSEKADFIYNANAELEGAQIFARQAFGPRSTAKPEDKQLAIDRLFTAVYSTEYLVNGLKAYDGMYQAIGAEPRPVFNRATVWLQQLIPTQLGAGELFVQGLRSNANKIGKMALLDPHLATYARVLRDAKMQWEAQQIEAPLKRSDEEKKPKKQLGFVPGDAFKAPEPPVPPPPPQALSDVARAMIWVNDYAELEILSLKYLELNGVFNKKSNEWDIPSAAVLNQMIEYANVAARRGVGYAQEIGVKTPLMALVFERASYLRNQPSSDTKLESLRQFWRCSLMGTICWQLGYVPRARATAVNVPDEPQGPDTTTSEARDMDTGEMVPPPIPDLAPGQEPPAATTEAVPGAQPVPVAAPVSEDEIPVAPRAVPVFPQEAPTQQEAPASNPPPSQPQTGLPPAPVSPATAP